MLTTNESDIKTALQSDAHGTTVRSSASYSSNTSLLDEQDGSVIDHDSTVRNFERSRHQFTQKQTPLPSGFMINDYRIDAVLGAGGFGITYLATDIHLYRKVAIKEYLPSDIAVRTLEQSVAPRSMQDNDTYQRGLDQFLLEARILATFRHRNIVRVTRFFEAHRTAYIVLDYERGQSLKAWWPSHHKLPERDLLLLLAPLLDGLAVIHQAGYLHRDIKPDNIHVRRTDQSFVLLDFGAASLARPERQQVAGAVTSGFAPPEQYDGAVQSASSDIYSFGATLYWMVSGQKPPAAPLRRLEKDPFVPAVQAGKGQYSTSFLHAVDWALSLDPASRPQNVAQLRRALFADYAEGLGLQEALRAEDVNESRASGIVTSTAPRRQNLTLTQFVRSILLPRTWPISIKMMLAMAVAALLPMLLTAYINLHTTLTTVSTNELRNLEQLAQGSAGRLAQLLDDSRNLSNYLASDANFAQFLENNTDDAKRAVTAKLASLVSANPDVSLATIMLPDGNAIASSDANVVGYNFRFRDYFKRAMQNRSTMTGIIVSAVDGKSGIFYASPIHAVNGSIAGVIVLRIRGSAVDDIFDSAHLGSQRIPMVIDGDGVVIYHPQTNLRYRSLAPLSAEQRNAIAADQRFGHSQLDSLDMPILAQAMLGATKEGHLSAYSSLSKKEEIIGYAPVRGQNWVVSISESRDFFEAPLNRLFDRVLGSVLLVGAISLVIALLFARSIVRPIKRLIHATHALKAGDYDKANVKVTSQDELGRLSRTFNVMIDVLRQRERERHSKVDAPRSGADSAADRR